MKLLLKVCSILCSISICSAFSYDDNDPKGPRNWGRINPNCDGRRQSPINFNWLEATPVFHGPRISIRDIDKQPTSIRYSNDGHGVSVTFNYADGVQPRITGGPLRSQSYIFHSLHVHWTSEHTVNCRSLEAELHLVHYNSKYGSLEQALSQSDGLAVLGLFYSVPILSNLPSQRRMGPFINGTVTVREPDSVFVQRTNLFTILDVVQTRTFTVWNYNGSLTVPDCNEAVTWMVHKFPIPINSLELEALRLIKDDTGNLISRNNRPVQALNGRQIFCY